MMMGKYRQFEALRCGIFTKLLHQQSDKIRDGEFKECTCKILLHQYRCKIPHCLLMCVWKRIVKFIKTCYSYTCYRVL